MRTSEALNLEQKLPYLSQIDQVTKVIVKPSIVKLGQILVLFYTKLFPGSVSLLGKITEFSETKMCCYCQYQFCSVE